MKPDYSLTPDELHVVADQDFFRKKAVISKKIRCVLEQLHQGLEAEISSQSFLAPAGFNPQAVQYVKGEYLENFPYQYLDLPRYYTRQDKLAFRSLFWWGHHMVFALIVEGPLVKHYRSNLFNRFAQIVDRNLCLCLSASLWEWKAGPGFTLDISQSNRSEVAAALDHRTYFKIARFLRFNDPSFENDAVMEEGLKTFRAILPIITC